MAKKPVKLNAIITYVYNKFIGELITVDTYTRDQHERINTILLHIFTAVIILQA